MYIYTYLFIIQQFLIGPRVDLSVNLGALFNTFDEADAAAGWEGEWGVAFGAGDWDVRVGESSGELHAGSATERKELRAWVWNEGLLLAALAFVFLGWVEKIVIEGGHYLVKG